MFASGWSEVIAPDEDERFAGYAAELRELQRRRSEKDGRPGRALHRKQNVGLAAFVDIRPDLPEVLRVRPFATPRRFEALVRFSNGAAHRDSDRQPDIHGLALQLLDVDGEKILGDHRTQDFLMIQRPVQPFSNPDDFLRLVRAGRGPQATFPLRILQTFGLFRGLGVLSRIGRMVLPKVPSYATARWYSATPIRWGATAVRLGLVPVAAPQANVSQGDNFYADDLAARLRVGPIRFDLVVQGFVDEATTPIEDAAVDWPSPYVPVATLEIPQQDLASEGARETSERVEAASFDPWHAVVELRPLGAMMRARKHAYFASVQERGAG